MPVKEPTTGASARPIHDRAIQDLSFIRRTMEGASSFTDVSGMGMIGVGASALVATFVARAQPSAGRWLTVWLIEAVLAASVSGAFIWRKARRRIGNEPRPVFGIAARKFLLGFWPAIFAGALLTFSSIDFSTVWTPGSVVPRLLPGTWLTLYGVAVLTAGAWSVRPVPAMGLGFMFLGSLTLFIPAIPADLMLALGFGVFQAAVGVVIARRHGG